MEDYTPSAECDAIVQTFESVARKMAGRPPLEQCRLLGNAGLCDLLSGESEGGPGLPVAIAVEVMRSAGKQRTAHPLTETLLAAKLLAQAGHEAAMRMRDGSAMATIAWRGRLEATRDGAGWLVSGQVSHAPAGNSAQLCLAMVDAGASTAGQAFAVLDLKAHGVAVAVDNAFDLERPFALLTVRGAVLAAEDIIVLAQAEARALQYAGRLLRAAEMLGVAEAAFALAQERAVTRVQFGKPIAAHQSVRHLLARDLLNLSGLAPSIAHAAHLLDEADADAGTAVEIACLLAASACPAIVENAMQLFGALGFTWEIPLHRLLRRARTLAQMRDVATARGALSHGLWQTPHTEMEKSFA